MQMIDRNAKMILAHAPKYHVGESETVEEAEEQAPTPATPEAENISPDTKKQTTAIITVSPTETSVITLDQIVNITSFCLFFIVPLVFWWGRYQRQP